MPSRESRTHVLKFLARTLNVWKILNFIASQEEDSLGKGFLWEYYLRKRGLASFWGKCL